MNCSSCGTQRLPQGAANCPRCGAATLYYYSTTGPVPNDPTVVSLPYTVAPPPPPPTMYGSQPSGAAPTPPSDTPPYATAPQAPYDSPLYQSSYAPYN